MGQRVPNLCFALQTFAPMDCVARRFRLVRRVRRQCSAIRTFVRLERVGPRLLAVHRPVSLLACASRLGKSVRPATTQHNAARRFVARHTCVKRLGLSVRRAPAPRSVRMEIAKMGSASPPLPPGRPARSLLNAVRGIVRRASVKWGDPMEQPVPSRGNVARRIARAACVSHLVPRVPSARRLVSALRRTA